MSERLDDGAQCEVIQDDLVELALGVLSGRSRSEVLRHVGSCPRCTADLEQLSLVADALLQLAPQLEPPVGFELRVAERLGEMMTTSRARRRRRVFIAAVVAASLLFGGFGLGALLGATNGETSTTANVTAANLTSDGQILGAVMVTPGSPAWMFMAIDASDWSGSVKCQVILAGGRVQTVGTFELSAGYGTWRVPLYDKAANLRGARVVEENGEVLASARFSA
jgi:hypothetical protein